MHALKLPATVTASLVLLWSTTVMAADLTPPVMSGLAREMSQFARTAAGDPVEAASNIAQRQRLADIASACSQVRSATQSFLESPSTNLEALATSDLSPTAGALGKAFAVTDRVFRLRDTYTQGLDGIEYHAEDFSDARKSIDEARTALTGVVTRFAADYSVIDATLGRARTTLRDCHDFFSTPAARHVAACWAAPTFTGTRSDGHGAVYPCKANAGGSLTGSATALLDLPASALTYGGSAFASDGATNPLKVDFAKLDQLISSWSGDLAAINDLVAYWTKDSRYYVVPLPARGGGTASAGVKKTARFVATYYISTVNNWLKSLDIMVDRVQASINPVRSQTWGGQISNGIMTFDPASSVVDVSHPDQVEMHLRNYFSCVVDGPIRINDDGTSGPSGTDWLEQELKAAYDHAVAAPSTAALRDLNLFPADFAKKADGSKIPVVDDNVAKEFYAALYDRLQKLFDREVYAYRVQGQSSSQTTEWKSVCSDATYIEYLGKCVCENSCQLVYYRPEMMASLMMGEGAKFLESKISPTANVWEAFSEQAGPLQADLEQKVYGPKLKYTAAIDRIVDQFAILPLSRALTLLDQDIQAKRRTLEIAVGAINDAITQYQATAGQGWDEQGFTGKAGYLLFTKSKETTVYYLYGGQYDALDAATVASIVGAPIVLSRPFDTNAASRAAIAANPYLQFDEKLKMSTDDIRLLNAHIDWLRLTSDRLHAVMAALKQGISFPADAAPITYENEVGDKKLITWDHSEERYSAAMTKLEQTVGRLDATAASLQRYIVNLEETRQTFRTVVLTTVGTVVSVATAGATTPAVYAMAWGSLSDVAVTGLMFTSDYMLGRPWEKLRGELGMDMTMIVVSIPAGLATDFAFRRLATISGLADHITKNVVGSVGLNAVAAGTTSLEMILVSSGINTALDPSISLKDQLSLWNLGASSFLGAGMSVVPSVLVALMSRGRGVKTAVLAPHEVELLVTKLRDQPTASRFAFDQAAFAGRQPKDFTHEDLVHLYQEWNRFKVMDLNENGAAISRGDDAADVAYQKLERLAGSSANELQINPKADEADDESPKASPAAMDRDFEMFQRSLDEHKAKMLDLYAQRYADVQPERTLAQLPKNAVQAARDAMADRNSKLYKYLLRFKIDPGDVDPDLLVKLVQETSDLLASPKQALSLLLDIENDVKIYQFAQNRGKQAGDPGYLEFWEAKLQWYLKVAAEHGYSDKLSFVGEDLSTVDAQSGAETPVEFFSELSDHAGLFFETQFLGGDIPLAAYNGTARAPGRDQSINAFILQGGTDCTDCGALLDLNLDGDKNVLNRFESSLRDAGSPSARQTLWDNFLATHGATYEAALKLIADSGGRTSENPRDPAGLQDASMLVTFITQGQDAQRNNHNQRHLDQELIGIYGFEQGLFTLKPGDPRTRNNYLPLAMIFKTDRAVRNRLVWDPATGYSGFQRQGSDLHLAIHKGMPGAGRFTVLSRIGSSARDAFDVEFHPAGVSSSDVDQLMAAGSVRNLGTSNAALAERLRQFGYVEDGVDINPSRLQAYRDLESAAWTKYFDGGDKGQLYDDLVAGRLIDPDEVIKASDYGPLMGGKKLTKDAFVRALNGMSTFVWNITNDFPANFFTDDRIAAHTFNCPESMTTFHFFMNPESMVGGIDALTRDQIVYIAQRYGTSGGRDAVTRLWGRGSESP